jgi:hypothetical protein
MTVLDDYTVREEVKRAKRNIHQACRGVAPVKFHGWEIRIPDHGLVCLVIRYRCGATEETYNIAY